MRKLPATIVVLLGWLASVDAQTPVLRRDALASQLDALTSIGALSGAILRSRSATATLENWCGEHHLADPARIVAHLVPRVRKRPSSEQLRRLEVTRDRELTYRRVRLQCGTHVLSEADNWYVPARLTAEMNRLLETTDTPFGRAVAALEPYRRTFAVKMLWTDSARPVPEALFEHHAVLYTQGGTPFSEVTEVYRRGLLDAPALRAADAAAQEVRSARTAQNEAIAAGDLDRVAAFWTDDVTIRRALGQPVSGRAAARQALDPPAPPAPRIVYQRLTGEVEISSQWPLAFETGSWQGHLDTVTGPTVIAGRFSSHWVKRGDRWLIRSEVFVALTCSGVGCQSAAVP